jgi:hypothetical protein
MAPERRARADDPVSRYVADLQRRYPDFRREHAAELAQLGTDFASRVFQDYFLFGDRTSMESLLHVMLTPAERDRIQVDPEFTQAWHIFVDMCWMRKRFQRALIVLAVILGSFALVLFVYWALPYVAGPRGK